MTEADLAASDATADTREGAGPMCDEQAADLIAGLNLFNVGSKKFPDGEIRGQLALMQQQGE